MGELIWQVKKINIDELKKIDYNPRFIKEEEYNKLDSSIGELGNFKPLIIDQDNNIIGGNQRFEVLKKNGYAEVEVSYPSRKLTKKEIKKIILLDNTHNGEFDIDILANQFEAELKELELEISGLDLNVDTSTVKEDDYKEPDKLETTVKVGDIYLLGNHRLMCGDSTKIEDVEILMDGQKADMILTDPPYGYSYESNYQNKHKMLLNDDVILNFLPNAFVFSNINTAFYIFCSWQTIKDWIIQIEKTELKLKNLIVWKKNNWSMGDLKGAYAGQHELILFAHKGRVELIGERDRDVWEFDRQPPDLHPTMKPLDLCSKAINNHKGSVLDLFGGSGSTLIACEQLNRKCYTMELDPYYCNVIIDRWEKLTNQKAQKIK